MLISRFAGAYEPGDSIKKTGQCRVNSVAEIRIPAKLAVRRVPDGRGARGKEEMSPMRHVLATLLSLTISVTAHSRSTDLDGNGEVNVDDVDVMCEVISGALDPYRWQDVVLSLESVARFDFNDNGVVFPRQARGFGEDPSPGDFETYLAIIGKPQGDFNFDGVFDSHDFVHVFAQPGVADRYYHRMRTEGDHIPSAWSQGDANCNSIFDIWDMYRLWEVRDSYASEPVSNVPEPSGWLLFAVAIPCFRLFRAAP